MMNIDTTKISVLYLITEKYTEDIQFIKHMYLMFPVTKLEDDLIGDSSRKITLTYGHASYILHKNHQISSIISILCLYLLMTF